jgi:hypothetical protein
MGAAPRRRCAARFTCVVALWCVELSGKYDSDIGIGLAGQLSNFFPFGDKHSVCYGRSRRSVYDLIGWSECVIDVTKLAHDVAHHKVNALDALLNLTALAVLEPNRVALQDGGKRLHPLVLRLAEAKVPIIPHLPRHTHFDGALALIFGEQFAPLLYAFCEFGLSHHFEHGRLLLADVRSLLCET